MPASAVTLDYLGEDTLDREAADQTTDAYVADPGQAWRTPG